MAITRKKSLAINLGAIVANATSAAKSARASSQSKQEAAFQAEVANGMSYDAQIAFRQQQISDAQAETAPDSDYISQLQQSVGNIQKLNRFTKYRAKYQTSFASLKAGTETAQQHLDILNNLLSSTTDPTLREEIQGNIITASDDLKRSQDDILANQIKKAQYDGTPAVLTSTISTVKDKRAMAVLAGNEDAVASYDATLSVLNQQMNKVSVENTTDKLQVSAISKGLTPTSKLSAMNAEIMASNNTDPVTINGKTYESTAAYWTQTRDSYLSGNGSGIFQDFFTELNNTFVDKLNAAIARDGFATTVTMDGIKADTDALKTKPEMAPFLQQVENLQATTLGKAFQSTATTIINRANYTGDFKGADTSLQAYGTKYGVDAQSYRLVLGDNLQQQVSRTANANNVSPDVAAKALGVDKVLPASDFATPTPTTDAPKAPTPSRVFTTKENADLSAAQARVASGSGSAIDKQNVAYAVKQGWVATVAPVATPTVPNPTSTTTPVPDVPPAPTPAPAVGTSPSQPVTPTPTATPTPTNAPVVTPAPVAPTAQPKTTTTPTPTPTPVKTTKPYTGVSVVDYLAQNKQDTSFSTRSKLAADHGITGYTGSAEQNTTLLKKLQEAA